MDKALFRKYASLRAKMKTLEAEEAELKEEILGTMKSQKVDKSETAWGIFTIGTRPSWTYTAAVKALEEKWKLAKVKEEQSGAAKKKLTEFLRFTEPKEE